MDEEQPPATAPAEVGESWQRLMWAMVGVQFVMTLGFTILSPILPLFLPKLGVHKDAMIDLWAGILNGTTPFVAAFASPLWGKIADVKGRKQALIRASVAIGIFTIGMGVSQNVWEFLGARILMGAFAGFSAASIALVASQVPEGKLGYALGWLSTGQLVGGLGGPILGGGISDLTGSYRIPFFVMAGLTFLALGLVSFLVHEDFTPPKPGGRKPGVVDALHQLLRARGLLALFMVLLLSTFAVRTIQPVVTLFVEQITGNSTAIVATLAGVAFSITGAADVIASPFLGKRSDVIGYRRVLLICLMGAAITTVPQAFANNFWVFVAERFAVGCFIGGILPTANALVGRQVPRAQRGTVYGMTASATFLGNSLGPITGGGLAAAVSIRFVFIVTAVLLGLTWLWVYLRVPEYQDPQAAGAGAAQ
jgi:DHA1 family multidrug resistance protein-like MFS transporter